MQRDLDTSLADHQWVINGALPAAKAGMASVRCRWLRSPSLMQIR
jgi:hypothetical protein